jgi:superfamily II DNA/RNA helicase
LISHLNLGYVDFSQLDVLILDEADRMLDMGFLGDIMRIIKFINEDRQTLLFSATMPGRIVELSKKILKSPIRINIALSKPAEGVLQGAYVVYEEQKPALIAKLVDKEDLTSVIVFASTKKAVRMVYDALKKKGISSGTISSDLDQKEREQMLLDFRNRKVKVLVATDVVSRGIDIDGIDLVVNYDVPSDAEDYVHRIGRTARAKSTGVALTLIGPDGQNKFSRIEQLIESEVRKLKVPDELGAVPEYRPGSGKGSGGKKHFRKGKKGGGKKRAHGKSNKDR